MGRLRGRWVMPLLTHPPQDPVTPTRDGYMFAEALKKAFKFTRPVVISSRKHSGKCVSGIGAYVVLNPDGWIITAGHIAQEILGLDQAVVSHQEREAQRLAVEADSDLTSKQKQRRMKSLRPGRESVTNYSTWWGQDALTVRNFQIIAEADVAVGQLEGFDPAWVSEYPAIKDPSSKLAVGTSLCRLGFPLHQIRVKSRVVCKSERKLLDASVRLPWRPPWARGGRGPGSGARSRRG